MRKPKLILLAVFIFALNLIWEFSAYGLYTDLTGIPATFHLVIASLADLFLVGFIFFIVSIFRRATGWIEKPQALDYLIIVFLGALIASIIEIYSLSEGKWMYTSLMPTIFGIGLSPLIQLFTTAILSLLLIQWLGK